MDSRLHAAYELCRQIHRRHGRSYYLATRLLPAAERRHVHSLYAFARYADEIVDAIDGPPLAVRERQLHALGAALGLAAVPSHVPGARSGSAIFPPSPHPGRPAIPPAILPAISRTIDELALAPADLSAFLDSMSMDIHIRTYATYADLTKYMNGSAAVIGTMMLPILRPTDPAAAREPARQLGLAFQLTNFIRDVAEDLQRDRVYLPLEDLDRFEVSPAELRSAARSQRCPRGVGRLIEFEIDRARRHYAAAAIGLAYLPANSRLCVDAAYRLYAGILDEVERRGHNVFAGRAAVSRPRRARLIAQALLSGVAPAERRALSPAPRQLGADGAVI